MADFEIGGLSEVLKKMRSLAPKLEKAALKKAVRKGAQVIRKAAIANAKRIDNPDTKDSSIYKKISVQESKRLSRSEGGVAMRVGVRGGGRVTNETGNTGHFRFLELGTSQMAAQPFLRPALDSEAGEAVVVIGEALSAELDRMAL